MCGVSCVLLMLPPVGWVSYVISRCPPLETVLMKAICAITRAASPQPRGVGGWLLQGPHGLYTQLYHIHSHLNLLAFLLTALGGHYSVMTPFSWGDNLPQISLKEGIQKYIYLYPEIGNVCSKSMLYFPHFVEPWVLSRLVCIRE